MHPISSLSLDHSGLITHHPNSSNVVCVKRLIPLVRATALVQLTLYVDHRPIHYPTRFHSSGAKLYVLVGMILSGRKNEIRHAVARRQQQQNK